MCTEYLQHIHPLSPFPHLLPPPTGINSCSPIFEEEEDEEGGGGGREVGRAKGRG
jgi:hypothetical protein